MGALLGGLGAKLASGVLGSVVGGFGGKETQESTSKTSGSRSSSSTQNLNNLTEALEDPAFAEFRKLLLPKILELTEQASQPVYTDAQIASTLADINKQFSKGDIDPALAGRGLLGSGLQAALRNERDMGRNATASQFFTQLPFMERQAKTANMNQALQLATGFAGRAPINQRTTGTQTGSANETFDQTSNTVGSGGQGFGGAFANNLGGWLGSKSGQSAMGKLFGLGG